MRLNNSSLLVKLQRKNRGNVKLIKAIDNLMDDLKSHQFSAWEN